ncbi:hypothetical protein FJQ98_14050 [Lysinibacillus agricola]|uniref:Uncharacterized protein n=1 Tax=Lysinibacillus agricola TaxID=2590012 RepID=A0ABX7AKS4_9BACI|nr:MULTISPECIES: hypothetical protein [Lysinibacillus]KOS64617.1 hypothetical protein AN161_00910 [Lysinibacillus sp. FJAT-14222]QQP10410.1 hypothetical protein FJQ98_14050 [Lysinibacillus agricola]
MAIKKYERINFLDHILRIDEKGDFIPVIDLSTGTQKNERVTGLPVWEALQEGTRHNQKVMNHLDENIEINRNYLISLEATIRRIQIQLELDDRVSGNSETFVDALDGEQARKMELDTVKTVVKDTIPIGATTLNVVDASGFQPLTEVTLYDSTNSEDILITVIESNVLTVQATKKNYSKGAFIARSNAELDVVQQRLKPGLWGTYSVSMNEVV